MSRALAALVVTLLLCSRARAEVVLAPAEDGAVGAWLVAGALTQEHCEAPVPSGLSPQKGARAGSAAFRLLAVPQGALDLATALGAGKKRGPCALAAAVLVVEQELDGWLLVSADGPSDVLVGGKLLRAERDKRLRDGAWDALRLRLPKGRHALVIRSRHPGEHWALAARLLDAAELAPPRGVAWTLPGTDGADASRLSRELATIELSPGLGADGYLPRLSVAFENGAPRGGAIPLAVELVAGSEKLASLSLGRVAIGARAVHRFEAALPLLRAPSGAAIERVTARVRLAATRAERSFLADARAPALIGRARALAEKLRTSRPKGFRDVDAVAATLEWRIERVRRAQTEARLRRALDRLDALVRDAETGSDPLARPGIVSIAQRSALDGEPEPVTLQIPASFGKDPARRYPLVVVLHGLNGTPSSVLRAFFDVPRLTGPRVDGFVLAPSAYGNAFYRGPGEHEVLRAIDWALSVFPIDPDRISITGVSMGGTGSASVALRHAGRFAAASPLCGYHSFFVRRDTSQRPIRPWEQDRMHHWSPASWAENGRGLPLWVAHGTQDFPLENSRVLIARYKELGYPITEEWPDTGHSVWEKTWEGARMWPWLSGKQRDREPSRVTLKTDSLATAERAWARIVRLEQPGRMGLLDASITDPTHVTVSTRGVSSFVLARTSKLARDRAVNVVVDGGALDFAPAEPIAARRETKGWQKGAREPAAGEKSAGAEGPIREVFDGPLVFVWGSGNPRTARANREVAEAFARTRHGPSIHYRVMSDVELDDATRRTHALFLVGTASDHQLLAELGARLPLRVEAGSLRVGARVHAGSGIGAIFVYPSPYSAHRTLVVVTGTDAAGIWRALSLPQLLPDFLVYDAALSPAAGEQILGTGRVLAGGFFDHAWKLPADPNDPESAKTAP